MTCVLAVPGNEQHAAQLAERLGVTPCPVELRRFPDGELYVRVNADLTGKDVVLVGSLLGSGDSFLTIAFLAGTARDLGATSVGLVAPYLAYMRQDAQFHPGEGVTAQYVGKLMSQVVDWLVTVDPHLHRLDALERVYSIPTSIARSAPAIASYVASQVEHPVLVGPDAESVQWVSAVAEGCGAPFLILEKTRRGDRDVSINLRTAFGGAARPGSPGLAITTPEKAWNGHTPVLIDDIVSTGKTMIEATRALRAAGSAPPLCIAIHAVFADALETELLSAGARGIVTCDTVPHATNRICIADSIASAVRARMGASIRTS